MFFVLFVMIVIFAIYSFNKYKVNNIYFSNKDEVLVYNPFSEKWEKSKERPLTTIEDLINAGNFNQDGFHNYSLLRGYFDHYDKKNGLLYIKNNLPFSDLYEVVALKTSPNQTAYCTPQTITSSLTGETMYTISTRFPVKDGGTLYTNEEKLIDFGNFLKKASQNTYLLVQLTDLYSSNKTNYLYKLVVVGICDQEIF